MLKKKLKNLFVFPSVCMSISVRLLLLPFPTPQSSWQRIQFEAIILFFLLLVFMWLLLHPSLHVVILLLFHSPWYNRNGWLGAKHQVTSLAYLFHPSVHVGFFFCVALHFMIFLIIFFNLHFISFFIFYVCVCTFRLFVCLFHPLFHVLLLLFHL